MTDIQQVSTLSLKHATKVVQALVQAKVVPFIKGSPAIGKSAIVKQIANELGLKVIDIRLSQVDPVYLMGFPDVTTHSTKASFKPLDLFPLETDEIPAGYNGWLIFFDEINSAPQSIQAAAYRIILDREVGCWKLHDKALIAAAGNLETDNAIVMPMSSALVSRMAHLQVEVDAQDWLEWAEENDIHPYISGYIRFKPSDLYTFDPNAAETAYASPRTWEMVNRALSADFDTPIRYNIVESLCGSQVATDFETFLKYLMDLPSLEKIVKSPEKTEIPSSLSAQWVLTSRTRVEANRIGREILTENPTAERKAEIKHIGEQLAIYVSRLTPELQVLIFKDLIRNKILGGDNENIKKFCLENKDLLLLK